MLNKAVSINDDARLAADTVAPHARRGKRNGRRCVVTGETGPRERMIRFVLDPDGAVAPDLAETLPGRGAWVRARRRDVEKAAGGGALKRAFRADVRTNGLAELVEARLRARALSALGLARRGGALVLGFDKVEALLKEGAAALLASASDAAADGARKLERLAGGVPVVRVFTSEEISAALGREGLRHVAFRARGDAANRMRDVLRYAHFNAPPAENHEGPAVAGTESGSAGPH